MRVRPVAPSPRPAARRHAARLFAGLVLAAATLAAATATGATHWRTVKPERARGEVCLLANGHETTRVLLDPRVPAVVKVTGPRRVRIVTRSGVPAGSAEAAWTVVAALDGREVARRAHTAAPLPAVTSCRDAAGRWSAQRTITLVVPAGEHELRVTAEGTAGAQVAARFRRESRLKKVPEVPFAPEGYAAARRLQLESGQQSICYAFGPATPLRFTLTGPLTVRILTRLDFTQTMNGSQSYSVAIEQDGQPGRTYHLSSSRQDGVGYVGLSDIVPGQRRQLLLKIPRGQHRYALRCVRPGDCAMTAVILMPRSGLGAGKGAGEGGGS